METFRRTRKFKKINIGDYKAIECRFGIVMVKSFSFSDIELALSTKSVFPTFNNLTIINSEDNYNIELTYNILN
tara:strand:- start:21429 stop:21650 length:222 start_codon:yes stop_codon:yes gene_type:complete